MLLDEILAQGWRLHLCPLIVNVLSVRGQADLCCLETIKHKQTCHLAVVVVVNGLSDPVDNPV
jgi:hypothetical protein